MIYEIKVPFLGGTNHFLVAADSEDDAIQKVVKRFVEFRGRVNTARLLGEVVSIVAAEPLITPVGL